MDEGGVLTCEAFIEGVQGALKKVDEEEEDDDEGEEEEDAW